MSSIGVIDCQIAGISGDMFLSALVDAGANKQKVHDSIMQCAKFLKGSNIRKLEFVKHQTHGFSATKMEMSYRDSVKERRGSEMYRSLASCCDSLELTNKAKAFALESFQTIVAAEAQIHGEEFTKVHLHEASSIDTFADIVGSAVALDDLGLFSSTVYSTKVAVGGGTIKFSHGKTPNPSPAILEIFKGKQFTLEGGQADRELCTPTGAALLVNIASGSALYYPSIKPERIGYGMGSQELEGFANVLRIVIGKSSEDWTRDSIVQIETNVDDVSGEILGSLIERLIEAGAKDVTITAGITKKNRPTNLIRIISDHEHMNSMLETLFNESGTLGARIQQVDRVLFPRSSLIIPIKIEDGTFHVNVKIVSGPTGKVKWAKPEFDDIVLIASKTRMPVKQVSDIVNTLVAQSTGLA